MELDKGYKPYHIKVREGDKIYSSFIDGYITVRKIVTNEEWYYTFDDDTLKGKHKLYKAKDRLSDLMNNFLSYDFHY